MTIGRKLNHLVSIKTRKIISEKNKGRHFSVKTEFKKGHILNWKGDNAGKDAMHKWVIKWKGKPDHCEMCGKTEKRMYHWANIDHKYRRVLEDYISMCVPCHRKYDYKKYGKPKRRKTKE